jgi:hypothetical protein
MLILHILKCGRPTAVDAGVQCESGFVAEKSFQVIQGRSAPQRQSRDVFNFRALVHHWIASFAS